MFGAEKHKANSLSCAYTSLTSYYFGAFTVNYVRVSCSSLCFFPERNLCPMNVCDTCDDRSRGDLSKNALKPVQKVRTGPRN
jgi:hypothetical protein